MSETAAERSTVGRVALGAAVAAAGAAVGLLFTTKPKRLRAALPELQSGAGSLVGDLKGRVEGLSDGRSRQQSAGDREDVDDRADRRRERQERRERRRQKSET